MNILQDIMGLITKRKIKTPSDNDYIVSAAYTNVQEVLKPQPKMEANLLNIGALKSYILTNSVDKEYVNNRLVVETTSGYTLTNADSGGIVIFKTTAAQTLTIPTGLAAGFECTFVTLTGVTLTVVSAGNTLNNAAGSTMAANLSFTLKRMITANTYITSGNL